MKPVFIILVLVACAFSYPYPAKKHRPALHVSISAVALVSTYAFLDMDDKHRAFFAYLIAFSLGLGKETLDKATGGKFDYRDMYYNQIGLIFGFVLVLPFN